MLSVQDLHKSYQVGKTTYEVLKGVSLEVAKGEFVAVMGPSGSGKTTLLNCISCYIPADSGSIRLGSQELARLDEDTLAAVRNKKLGFVFQDFNLLDTFSLEDNILLPLVLAGQKYSQMSTKLGPLAAKLGIDGLLKKYPYEVSGGQKQRAAVARALITDPRLILADEPTGALDSKSTDELLGVFERINQSGQTILMVTHSVKAASKAGRVLFIKDGEVFHQVYKGEQTDEQFYQNISATLTMLATGGERQ